MTNALKSSRARLGSLLMFFPGLALAMSSILKFARVAGVVHEMTIMGFTGGRYALVATLELLSAILYFYPRTRSFGLLFLSAFIGGAICTHVQMGELAKGVPPAILLTLAWIGAWLRHPEVFWSFRTASSAGSLRREERERQLASHGA
jgi:hypothetical protein